MNKEQEINIAICAQAGQGLEKAQELLSQIAKRHNYYCSSVKDYQSRIRGGVNCSTVRISQEERNGYKKEIDVLFALTKGAIEHLSLNGRITKDTLVIHDKSSPVENIEVFSSIEVDFDALALEAGSKITVNSVALGIISGLMNFDRSITENTVVKDFSSSEAVQMNINAVHKGHEKWDEIKNSLEYGVRIEEKREVSDKLLITGNDSLGLGCIAGGCDFISYYPMTPGAALYNFLSGAGHSFGIAFEQCEDEISVINMAIGAWYSGARAMITTSGGGFDLMCEAISLAGITESPIVVHIAQRPGPATGLPTRTEQADLELALYSGHGEFPRIVFVPSTPQSAYEIGSVAFNLADKFQIPVFILSDQYFIDSYFTSDAFNSEKPIEDYVMETQQGYNRYQITDNGISPRGIPGYGEGFVCVDSDEHNEKGEIEENPINRKNMVDKRLRKLEEIKKDILEPEFFGDADYQTLIISWGSTYSTVKEAVNRLNGVAMLHFSQLYPLHESIKKYVNDSEKKIIVAENNATGQFAKLIKLHTGAKNILQILKYDGYPFDVEELTQRVKELMNG